MLRPTFHARSEESHVSPKVLREVYGLVSSHALLTSNGELIKSQNGSAIDTSLGTPVILDVFIASLIVMDTRRPLGDANGWASIFFSSNTLP